jgi:hypothetical protein
MTFSIKNEWKTKRKGRWPPLKANETNKLSEKNMTEFVFKILALKLPIVKC